MAQVFNIVNNWLRQNVLSSNINKTYYLKFSIRSPPSTSLNIFCHNCPSPLDNTCTSCPKIPITDNVKYLGITIDSQLRFSKNIELLTGRIRKFLFVFKKLRTFVDRPSLMIVYMALCQSLLAYCISSWGGASKTILLPLERAQRAVLKVGTFRPYYFCTAERYRQCKVLTIRQLFITQTLLKQHTLLSYKPEIREIRRINLSVRMGIEHITPLHKDFSCSWALIFTISLTKY